MNADFQMPFGKHRGEALSDIPVGYLDWLIGQDWLKPDLKEIVTKHLETRPEWQQMGDDE